MVQHGGRNLEAIYTLLHFISLKHGFENEVSVKTEKSNNIIAILLPKFRSSRFWRFRTADMGKDLNMLLFRLRDLRLPSSPRNAFSDSDTRLLRPRLRWARLAP